MGDAVVAGHGQPNDQVALLANGKAIANIDADGAGNFVIIPTPLAPGNYELTLEAQRPGEPLRLSRQVVTVLVPAKGQKEPRRRCRRAGQAERRAGRYGRTAGGQTGQHR